MKDLYFEDPDREYPGTPAVFARRVLDTDLYQWQIDVLGWFEKPWGRTQGALVTPNGAGKSSGVVAALALWWIAAHKHSRVVITTKDSKQLEQQLYPALSLHRSKFPLWKWTTSPYVEVTTNTGSRLVAFTTNDSGRAEGWHKRDNHFGPLLIIVDEAKSVDEEIFQAIDRCTFNALLYVSSPGLMLGSFFNAFTRHAALFQRRKVSLTECPHIPRERIDSIVAKYGERHPLTLSSIHGEFMDQDELTSFVFPLSAVQRHPAKPAARAARRPLCLL